jgi:hypothetical protein
VRAVLLAIIVCACGSGDDPDDPPNVEAITIASGTGGRFDDETRMRRIVDTALAQVRRGQAQVPAVPTRIVRPCDPFSSIAGCTPTLTISRVDVQRGPAQAADVVNVAREHLEGCLGSVAVSGRISLLVEASGRARYVIVPTTFGTHRDCMRGALQSKIYPQNATFYTIDVDLDFR